MQFKSNVQFQGIPVKEKEKKLNFTQNMDEVNKNKNKDLGTKAFPDRISIFTTKQIDKQKIHTIKIIKSSIMYCDA